MAQPTGTFAYTMATGEPQLAAVDPALVAPTSYKADRAEIWREIARLVSEEGLPAPHRVSLHAVVMIGMEYGDRDGVDAWAKRLGLDTPQLDEPHEGADGEARRRYGNSEWFKVSFLGWPVSVDTMTDREGGQS